MAAHEVSRRSFLASAGVAGAATLTAACAPQAAPAPAVAPAAREQPPQKAAWEQQWDDLVVAAKKEGKISIATIAGGAIRDAVATFEKAFPGITVEQQGFSSVSLLIPKVLQERDAGAYLWDVAQTSPNNLYNNLYPKGALSPIRPLLFRPDVIGNNFWRNGFDYGFADDKDKQVAYNAFANSNPLFWVNSDLVPDGKLTSVKDLLRPEWKGGKILLADVRNGNTWVAMAAVRQNLGDDAVKQLIVDQQPVFLRDARQIAEAMVRGQYAVATGVTPQALAEFTDQGLGKNLKRIDLPEARNVSSKGSIMVFNRAPNPNAAKLFANWFLTKETAQVWSKAIQENSRRTDVPPFDAALETKADGKYLITSHISNGAILTDTMEYLVKLVS